MKVWEAAIIVLQRTQNDAVMWGDIALLHQIAEEMGWPEESFKTPAKVLKALRSNPGKLRSLKTRSINPARMVSIFRLPPAMEHLALTRKASHGN